VSFDTLTAAGLCVEVGDFRRFAKPALLSGFLGVVPSEYTSDSKRVQGQTTKAAGHDSLHVSLSAPTYRTLTTLIK
jgi:transposase